MADWDEHEHPRHAAGTPGGRGGEFRDAGAGWAQRLAQQLGPSAPDRGWLEETVEKGIEIDRTRAWGGIDSHTEFVTYGMPSGEERRLIHKRATDRQKAAREVAVSHIAEAIGAPVPVAMIDPESRWAVYMPVVEGRSPLAIIAERLQQQLIDEETWDEQAGEIGTEWVWNYAEETDAEAEFEGNPRYIESFAGRLLGLLDLLVNNNDRHLGNWLVDGDRVIGIDHTHVDLEEQPATTSMSGSPFTAPYFDVFYPGGQLVDFDWLHPNDMGLIARRLIALFSEDGPLAMHTFPGSVVDEEVLQARLRLIAAHAKGTERRLS